MKRRAEVGVALVVLLVLVAAALVSTRVGSPTGAFVTVSAGTPIAGYRRRKEPDYDDLHARVNEMKRIMKR